MTDRGLPLADGAPACPFVAFEHDRDARATSPDHRHRCYAEVRPAPRALAHQEAYCLSPAFPVCPTFQDWARREAAQAKAAADREAGPAEADDGGESERERDRDDERDDRYGPGGYGSPGDEAGGLDSRQRNPPRNWAAPPPWLSSRDDDMEDEEPEVQAQPPIRGGGLSGSFADRLAGGSASGMPAGQAGGPQGRQVSAPQRWADEPEVGDDRTEGREGRDASPSSARRSPRDARHAATPALPGPSWERPKRLEAYPTLKTRIGLGSVRLPPILVGVGALVLAAVALFSLPTLLGLFGEGDGTGGSPSPSAGTSAGPSGPPAEATPTPGPTQLVYLVQEGDTMSKIADRFGVPLAALIEANRDNIPNPDVLQIDQEVIIPVAAPTTLPGVTPSPSPTPSA
jgi:hypothetical protein